MIADLLILLGSFMFFIASIGLIRMPDPIARVHAATKASSLGVILLTVAAAIKFPAPGSLFTLGFTLLLVLLTAPMACQAIASRLIPPGDRKAKTIQDKQ